MKALPSSVLPLLGAPACRRFAVGLSLVAAALAFTPRAEAAAIAKENNTEDLAAGTSWIGGVPPTNLDIATWDTAVASANTSPLLTSSTWLGINIIAPQGPVGITLQSGGQARTLTLGASGIDMSTATQDLTIGGSGNVRLATGVTATFNVATGRTLTLNSTLNTQGNTTTLNLSGAGSTNLNGSVSNNTSPLNINTFGTGVLSFTGALGTIASVNALSATGAGSAVVVNGSSVTSSALSTYGGNSATARFELQTGSASFNGGIRTGTADGTVIRIGGGAFTASSVQLQRTVSFTTAPAAASTTNGLIVSGGTANITGNLDIATSNSSASALVNGGALTVGGQLTISNSSNTRFSILQVSSGSLTSTDTVNGIVLSANTTTTNNSVLLLSGGTTTAERIGFGVAGSTANSTGALRVTGGTLYLGSGGIVLASANPYTATISLAGATIGAKASWSSSLPMSLDGPVTFKAADAVDAPFNIALGGSISGSANLVKTGGGMLTLGGANSYTGATQVEAGTLLASGSIASSASVTAINSRFELGASNVIGDLAPVALSSGTFATGGFSETAGQFSMATGVIDFGAGASTLQFAASGALTWTGTLSITNWSGQTAGGGTDRLLFGASSSGLTTTQLGMVRFINPAGFTPGIYGAAILGSGEIVAVPEPGSALLLAGMVAGLAGGRRLRRSRKCAA